MRGRLVVIGAVVVLALVAGWGASSGSPGGGSVAAPPEVPERGGVLRLALERPHHLDPALTSPVPVSESIVADLLFDGLTAPGATPGRVVPALAERWRADSTLRTWRFRLRDDARFGDGRRVRASDVEATFDRIAEAGAMAPLSSLLRGVRAVSTPSRRVVRIELDEPMAALPEVLAAPGFGVVPRDAGPVGDPAFDRAPVGSGPFGLRRGEALSGADARRLRLVRAETSGALLDGVDLFLRDDAAGAYGAFTAGRADWSLVPAGEQADRARALALPASLFYGFDLFSPDLTDVRFREAIVRAVDRRAIAEDVYGTGLTAARGVVPEAAGGGADPCRGRCDHDPERARALVAEVFPMGGIPAVTIDVEEGGRQQEVATAIAADLRAVDIPAVVRPRAFEEYRSFAATPSADRRLFRLGWTGAYPSPAAYLEPLFGADAPDNVVGLAKPAVDRALARARREADPETRVDLLVRAERAALSDLPVLPLGHYVTRVVTSERVQDLAFTPSGTFEASQVWLRTAGQ